jgi:hypothetical protein
LSTTGYFLKNRALCLNLFLKALLKVHLFLYPTAGITSFTHSLPPAVAGLLSFAPVPHTRESFHFPFPGTGAAG